jgi:hypothetical protein
MLIGVLIVVGGEREWDHGWVTGPCWGSGYAESAFNRVRLPTATISRAVL